MAELTPSSIFNLIHQVSFVIFIGYGRRTQTSVMFTDVRRKLGRLESFSDSAHRYHIEEAATKHRIPLNAVLVKMSLKQAISSTTSQITRVAGKIGAIIMVETNPREPIVLAGIGNTIGIE